MPTFTLCEPVPEWLEDEVEGHIEDVLRRLGISGSLFGRRYLAYAVRRAAVDPDLTLHITKELYLDVARRFDTTSSCVERSMRTAIARCWSGGGRETLDKVAGYHLTERPTNSEFIDLVASYIVRNP